jgi:hypothetical protein
MSFTFCFLPGNISFMADKKIHAAIENTSMWLGIRNFSSISAPPGQEGLSKKPSKTSLSWRARERSTHFESCESLCFCGDVVLILLITHDFRNKKKENVGTKNLDKMHPQLLA